MSQTASAAHPENGSPGSGGPWRNDGRGFSRCGGSWRWRPLELVAMILGFIVFWPIGLAILFFKFWQRKVDYRGDLADFAQTTCSDARKAWKRQWGGPGGDWRPGGWSGPANTGNRAFDEWKAAELARLEEERRRLVAAQREFAEFLDNLRHAKDREEFDRFMNARQAKSGDGPPAGEPKPWKPFDDKGAPQPGA